MKETLPWWFPKKLEMVLKNVIKQQFFLQEKKKIELQGKNKGRLINQEESFTVYETV